MPVRDPQELNEPRLTVSVLGIDMGLFSRYRGFSVVPET